MSGQMTGMDITAVQQLAQQLKTRADEIRTLMQQLTTQLENTQWAGPDREQFRSDWQGQYTQQLNAVIQGLEAASQRATANASEQEQASSH